MGKQLASCRSRTRANTCSLIVQGFQRCAGPANSKTRCHWCSSGHAGRVHTKLTDIWRQASLSIGEPGGRAPLLGNPKGMLSKALEMGIFSHTGPVLGNMGGRSFRSRGEWSYLAPLVSENISAPFFKQCFFRGGDITPQTPRQSNTTPPSPKTEITILFYTLNFVSIIKFKM